MADVEWFADVWSRGAVDYYVTLARRISPQELAERVARGPVQQLPDMTLREADARVDVSSIFTVGRLAVIGGWSVLVEVGGGDGMLTEPDVSRGGAEMLIFDPRQDDPPSYATYLKDGELLLNLPFAGEYDRGGAQPDVLLPEMLAAGVVTEGGPTEEEHAAPLDERRRRTLHMLGARFDLDLPKDIIEDASLPAVIIRTSAPSSW